MTHKPGTTTPTDRITAKVDEKFEPQVVIGNKESNPNTKTGSKHGKRKNIRKDPRPKLNRKQGSRNKPENKSKKGKKMDIINAIRHIIRNHKKNPNKVMSEYDNKEILSKAARKCMATCLAGWKESNDGLISENTDMVLSKDSWQIAEDGTAKLANGFQFDYDWLYDLSNAEKEIIKEDIDETEIDKDSFADTLSNASSLLRSLSDKEVKKYVLNAAKTDEDVDVMNLKKILEETGVNWKFIGAEINNEKINLMIRVRYTRDGTQEGVIEKKLSIEVKPSADVIDATREKINNDDEVNLGFDEKIEKEMNEHEKPEKDTDVDAGMDFEVKL